VTGIGLTVKIVPFLDGQVLALHGLAVSLEWQINPKSTFDWAEYWLNCLNCSSRAAACVALLPQLPVPSLHLPVLLAMVLSLHLPVLLTCCFHAFPPTSAAASSPASAAADTCADSPAYLLLLVSSPGPAAALALDS
jgi:hypothetical protein